MPTVKPVSITDNTPEGARAFIEHARQWTRERFRRSGKILPVAMMVGDRHPKTCELLDEPASSFMPLDPFFFENNASKDRLAETLHGLATGAGAFAIAFINEVWFQQPRSQEEAEAFASGRESLNDDKYKDSRIERVIVVYEHRALPAGKQTGGIWADILRPGRGKPRLGPWNGDEWGFSGRFVGLLPDDSYLTRTAAVLDELVKGARKMELSKERAAEIIARGGWHKRGMPPPTWLAQRLREMDW